MSKREHEDFVSEDEEEDHKRSRRYDSDEEECHENIADRIRESDKCVMDAVRSKYDGERADKEAEMIKRKYLITYMKKVISKLPMSKEIIDASAALTTGDEFLKMYSVAKTCVHSELHLKKLVAFNSMFDMISHIVGKGIHDRFVAPYLKDLVTEERLDAAYEAFRKTLSSDDCNTATELHCVAYLIQSEMEKDRPLKIPNPIFNRVTQQVKAASEYVTCILAALASKPFLPATVVPLESEEPLNKDDFSNL